MPLPRYGLTPQDRPSGLVPPPVALDGVTELRLHGVGGATPESLLDDVAPQQVAGDRIAGFYRTADLRGRHVEAYSWGGLTSHSGSRVLWVLLLPFALANVAGWMCTSRTHRSPGWFRLHRTAVRWASLTLTVNLQLMLSMTGLDLIAYQCGGQPGCAGRWWLLGPLRWAAVAEHPGRRILLGALLPLVALTALGALSLRSIKRYEQVIPPVATGTKLPHSRHSAAQPGLGLSDRRFWNGRRSAVDLGCLHLAIGLAAVALVVAHTARTTGHAAGVPANLPAWWLAGLVAGGVVVAGALVLAARDASPRGLPVALLATAAVAMVCAGWFAAAQPALAPLADPHLPGMRNAANIAFAVIFATLLLVLVSAVRGGRERGGFFGYGPFVALVMAVAILNTVLLSFMVMVSRLLGDDPALFPVVVFSLPYLVLVALVAGSGFGVYQLWTYWRAGQRWQAVRDWYEDHSPAPPDADEWTVSAARGPRARRWAGRVARARRFAQMPRDTDKLLAAMVAVGLVILLVLEVRVWIFRMEPWQTSWARTVSAYVGIGLPALMLLLLRRGWRSLDSRRRIGILWDVFTFWPRAYHPLAPPSYAERAVPELQRRLWRLHTAGGRVVLAAHSQGTVIAAAALLQRDERPPDGDRVALVSFGTPLGTLYRWAFPAYFDEQVLWRLAPGSNSDVELFDWRSYYYQTDYVGREVFAAAPQAGVDAELPDPPTCWHVRDQPAPAAGRHSGYWTDPAFWQEVDRLAGVLSRSPGEAPARPGPRSAVRRRPPAPR